MTKQVKINFPTILKTTLALGGALASGRDAPTLRYGSSDALTPHGEGRALKQMTFVPPSTPVAPPPPTPVTSPLSTPTTLSPVPAQAFQSISPGYYDILGGKTGCAAVVPDWNHYGACSEGLAPTLARVSALASQGCVGLNLDLYASDMSQTVAHNATIMNFVQQVVDHAASLGMVTLVGPSKDDVSMSNGAPTPATKTQLVALANQFIGNTHVGLNAGGLPANNGSETASIAQTYGDIATAVRAADFRGLITFTAPEQYGRAGLDYFLPTANRIQDPNVRFLVYPYSDGNTTETLSWLQPCAEGLPCAVVTGLQVNATLGIENNLSQVTSALTFARAHNIPAFTTPWDSNVISSGQGEQVMLAGDTCPESTVGVTVASVGQSLINLQKNLGN